MRLVVLASGNGSNLQSLLDAADDPTYPATVVAVGADRDDCYALTRAAKAEVPSFVVALADHSDRDSWDSALADAITEHRPDLVVLAGFMKILGSACLGRFGGRIINTHPALLPAFPGAHPVRDTLAYGVKLTGATVHFVDQVVDGGPIIAQASVPVRDDDDDETALHERIKRVERPLLVQTVRRLALAGWTITGRTVRIP